MFKNKPVTLLIAISLMFILVLISGILPLFGGTRGFGMNSGRPGSGQGNFDPSNLPEGFTPPDRGTMPNGGTPAQGFTQGDGTNSRGGFAGAMPINSISMKLIQLLRGVQIGAGILIALLGTASVVGMWLQKKWGRVLAIIASILVLAITITSLFQRMMGFTLIENLIKIIFAIAIMVLCLLPKSRLAPVTA